MLADRFLSDPWAQKLYLQYARDLPIIDYHNHLNPADIAADRHYDNITQLWIRSDPYKHRAMRILGVPERYITGNASDFDVFRTWLDCLPSLAGNPLYTWSVMELEQIFGLGPADRNSTPQHLWDRINALLPNLSAQTLLQKFRVEYCAPCASALDELSCFRPDKGLCPSLRADDLLRPSPMLLAQLSRLTGIRILSLSDYAQAIAARAAAFADKGCRFADQALDCGFVYSPDDGQNGQRFLRLLEGKPLPAQESLALQSHILRLLSGLYARHGMTMQLHLGAQRETSSRLRSIAGPFGGYAAMGEPLRISNLVRLLDDLEQQQDGLPRTILFNLNPADNAAIATLSGSYSKDGVTALVSQGPAWWWCDHHQGIRDMLEYFTSYSVLSTFPGMTTDSRSLLSLVRHDYFRRLLCQWMAEKIHLGVLPPDEAVLALIIQRICHDNASAILKAK